MLPFQVLFFYQRFECLLVSSILRVVVLKLLILRIFTWSRPSSYQLFFILEVIFLLNVESTAISAVTNCNVFWNCDFPVIEQRALEHPTMVCALENHRVTRGIEKAEPWGMWNIIRMQWIKVGKNRTRQMNLMVRSVSLWSNLPRKVLEFPSLKPGWMKHGQIIYRKHSNISNFCGWQTKVV